MSDSKNFGKTYSVKSLTDNATFYATFFGILQNTSKFCRMKLLNVTNLVKVATRNVIVYLEKLQQILMKNV